LHGLTFDLKFSKVARLFTFSSNYSSRWVYGDQTPHQCGTFSACISLV